MTAAAPRRPSTTAARSKHPRGADKITSPSMYTAAPSKPAAAPSKLATAPSKPATAPSRPAPSKPATAPNQPAPVPSEPTAASSKPAAPSEPTAVPSKPAAAPSKPAAPSEPTAASSKPAAPSEPTAAPSKPAAAPSERQRRADRIAAILDEHFPAPSIPLDHGDPFQLLVAVILSAQCTDVRVNMVTPRLFAVAPTAHAMAKLTPAQILPLIRTCGLAPGKAKALAAMSRILVDEHGGEVPADLEALERLPGVGHKTASVVLVQAFGMPAFPVDTHIHRLAGRWQLSRARTVEEVERDFKVLFPEDRWHLLHLQLIYFGRASCPAKGHVREACPICSWAMSASRARAEQRQGVSKPVSRKPAARRPRRS